MKDKASKFPAQVADECEMLAQQEIDYGDREAAALFMEPARAIRRTLKMLHRLNHRVHSGYNFNADPDCITQEVGDVLTGYVPTINHKKNKT